MLVLHHEVATTDDDALAIERRCDAVRHDIGDLGMAFAMLEAARGGGRHHGARHGMREMLLQAGRGAQHLVLGPIGHEGEHARDPGRRLGERSRLIEHDGVGGGDGLEMLGTLDGHALVRALAHGGEHADGRREPEGAGVVDHEGGRCLGKAFRGRRHKPRKQEVPRHEAVREVLAARLDLAFELLGGFNEIHDGAELGRCGLGAHADDDLALFNRGAGEDVVAGHALDGKRLAGECRLVDHGRTAYHHAVDAHGHAGARHDEVAHAETLGGHGDLLAVLEAPGVLGNGHEGANEFVL